MQEVRMKRVLLIYRKMIPSIRLCGHCQMEFLAQEGKLEYRSVQEMKLKKSDLNWADIVLLGRLDSWYEYQLTKKLKNAGKYLIYIIDDDLLNIPPEISSAAYYGQKEIQGYIRGMIEMSDAILSPSPLLLEKYAVDGRRAIQIEEPAIDPVPYKPHNPDKPVKIGFAGSIDRTGDIEVILKDALLRVKREYGDRVQIEFFGAIPSFAEALDARCIPYCESYDGYRKMLNSLEWDIGLAPMPDTPFHACKHYNKFVEYAAAGIVGIFSDIKPYSRLRTLEAPCIFCRNDADEWVLRIKELVSDFKKREKLRKVCLQYSIEDLSIEKCALALFDEEKLNATAKKGKSRTISVGVGVYKIYGILKKIVDLCNVYGWKLPLIVVKKMYFYIRNAN